MTDPQARTWHHARLADLRRLIERADTLDRLAHIEATTRHEMDDALRRALQQRVTALKAQGQR